MTDIQLVPGRPGTARVEYIAHREEAEAMFAKGYSVQMVYENLRERYSITCSYSAFCDYVRGQGKRLHSRKRRTAQNNATR